MTNEEAVEILKTHGNGVDLETVPKAAKSERDFRIALLIAIEALEKQIAARTSRV